MQTQQLTMLGCPSEQVVSFYPNFLSQAEADALLQHSEQLKWRQNTFSMYGKSFLLPRLEAMYGDEGLSYVYSGGKVVLSTEPWTDELLALKQRVEEASLTSFQVVIGNLYRSGRDHIGWHADKGVEMGENPAIASVSLGATRRFGVRSRETKQTDFYDLEHGSLIVMHAGCQTTHMHRIAKTSRPVGQRINWTFRPHQGATSHQA